MISNVLIHIYQNLGATDFTHSIYGKCLLYNIIGKANPH